MVFLTSSLVVAIAASIFVKNSSILSSSKLLLIEGDVAVLGLTTGVTCSLAEVGFSVGINRNSLKNKLSDAHNLFALRICSIYKKYNKAFFLDK